jgi:PAS domain S-box-containing protein
MRTILKKTISKKSNASQKAYTTASDDILRHLAFDNSLHANIISTVRNGKIVMINLAACKLLGYSKKEILTKTRATIFNINESSFKKMLKQRTAEGRSTALVTVIRKNGKLLSTEITSAVFMDEHGIQMAITTITDLSQGILRQKAIDIIKEKAVADDILLVQSKQDKIDVKKEKTVADNILLVQARQDKIDVKKDKVVADNILLVQAKQDRIDVKKDKTIADDILLVQLKQEKIDIKKDKIVADNILLVQAKQDKIDVKKEKIVADDILLVQSKQDKIDMKKDKIVADDILLVQSKQEKIDVKKDKQVADNILLVKETQDKIDVKKDKTVADNIILAQAKSDAILAENDRWIKYIGRSSYDVMCDWDIATGEIYVSESAEEVFGYKTKNKKVTFADFVACLLPREKDAVEKKLLQAIATGSKSWDDVFMLRRHDGSLASTICRASIVRDAKGKALRLIGAIQDVSRLQQLEQQLAEQTIEKKSYSEIFEVAARLSYEGIWDWNLLTNEFFLGEGFDELFGYAIKNLTGSMDDWSKHLHPEDKEGVEKGLQDVLISTASHWEHAYRFIRADGTIANVFGRASIIRNEDGKAVRMIGAIHDMSKQKVLEERLEQEIRLKETQIAEAAEDAKYTERSDIGKELHDNVNQLLGASRMYLEMAKRGGEKTEIYLNRSSEYTLNAIEEIRKLTKGLTTDIIKNLGLRDAIENAVLDMMEMNSIKIFCVLQDFIEDSVHHKFKLNVFRIVQEHLNNILKHADATKVTLTLDQNKSSITLIIADNGIGFDTAKKSKGIGIDNIKSRAIAFKGKADFLSQPGHGCVLTVTFPLPDLLPNES